MFNAHPYTDRTTTHGNTAKTAVMANGDSLGDGGTPTTEPAIMAVISTPELLEDILLYVDMKTVLLSQRVNKTFEATIAGSIAGSIKLQQKLFLKPMPPGTKYPCVEDCTDRSCENYQGDRSAGLQAPRPVHVNLLFLFHTPIHTTDKSPQYDHSAFLYTAEPLPFLPKRNWEPTIHLSVQSPNTEALAQASWRRMFVYQPVGPVDVTFGDPSNVRSSCRDPYSFWSFLKTDRYEEDDAEEGPPTMENILKRYYVGRPVPRGCF